MLKRCSMISIASVMAMTLLAAFIAAPFIAERAFTTDLLDPVPAAVVASPPSVGVAAR